MYKAPLRVCGGRDNEISTTNFYVVPPLLTHLRCKKFWKEFEVTHTRKQDTCVTAVTLIPWSLQTTHVCCFIVCLFLFFFLKFFVEHSSPQRKARMLDHLR